MSNVILRFDASGKVTGIGHQINFKAVGLETLGQTAVRRGSHVLPQRPFKRLAFRLLRRLFGESGRLADWTRTWKGPWQIDLSPVDGPCVSGYLHRSDAIAAEVRYLEWLQERKSL